MSHTSKLFENRKVKINNKSGFDLAHSNFLTQTVGTLTPICTIPMIPNDSISLGFMGQIKMPPMATSFYGRIDYRLEAFFVPYRILWGGWENFLTMPINDPYGTVIQRPKFLPNMSYSVSGGDTIFSGAIARGSLLDYLGMKNVSWGGSASTFYLNNILPLLAYHKIYDDWYRNANIQKPVFVRGSSTSVLANAPWTNVSFTVSNSSSSSGSDSTVDTDLNIGPNGGYLGSYGFSNKYVAQLKYGFNTFADSSSIFQLRQRNWAKDYFTTATLYPQQSGTSAGAGVSMTTASEGDETTFTISQLRQANILQKWLERNNIAGARYSDQIRATYGVLPSDALLDRPIFLGGSSFGIYTNSIAQSVNSSSSSEANPYSGIAGADSGQTSGFGKDSLVDKFTATEHGILMVIGSIVPHATYSTGSSRMFGWSTFGDIPNPMFEGLGEQAILKGELATSITPENSNTIFGYTQQYADAKYMNDEVHGLLVDGQNLDSFALQRSFANDVALTSNFIQIPKTYLNQVTSIDVSESGFSAWANFYFDVKKTSLLSQYTIPTLGENPNTHTESVPNTGRYL